MNKWLFKQSRFFEEDRKKIELSRIFWEGHKPTILSTIKSIVQEADHVGIPLFCYDYADSTLSENYPTYDGISLKFPMEFTGNLIITKEEKNTHYVRKRQEGSTLQITYNNLGMLLVFISPSTSGDSKAVDADINIYTTYNPAAVTEKVIRKWIKQFFLYHRCTGVLHHPSYTDRLKCYLLKIHCSVRAYLHPDERFKRVTGLYIPTISAFFAFLACCLVLYQIWKAP